MAIEVASLLNIELTMIQKTYDNESNETTMKLLESVRDMDVFILG